MRNRPLIPVLLSAFAMGGCFSRGVFVLDVHPMEAGMRRELTYFGPGEHPPPLATPVESETSGDGDTPPPPMESRSPVPRSPAVRAKPDPKQAARLRRIYGEPNEQGRWVRTFVTRGPKDLGGDGAFDRRQSPLGSLSTYIERVGGTDDLREMNRARRVAVDKLTRLITGWLMQEAGHLSDAPRLRRFLRSEFHRDLDVMTGMIAEAIRGQGMGTNDDGKSLRARLRLYLCEHEYLPHAGSKFDLQALVLGILARGLGTHRNSPLVYSLPFWQDTDVLRNSLDAFLRRTRAFRQLVARETAKGRIDPDKPYGDGAGLGLLAHVLAQAVGMDVYAVFTVPLVKIRLRCTVKPIETNGTYDPKTGIVSHELQLLPPPLPSSYFFAMWAEPARARQARLFGGVILEGEALEDFVDEWEALSIAERAQWVKLAKSLVPGETREQVIARLAPAVEAASTSREGIWVPTPLWELLKSVEWALQQAIERDRAATAAVDEAEAR